MDALEDAMLEDDASDSAAGAAVFLIFFGGPGDGLGLGRVFFCLPPPPPWHGAILW